MKFAEQGMAIAEIKVARKRRKFKQEDHEDDCGSDLAPLEEAPTKTALVVEGRASSAIACSFVGDLVFL